jgi:hypothetical protein
MSSSVLSQQQLDQYARDGYLLVSGLIPAEVAARAEAAMWRSVGVSPDDPSSWTSVPQNHQRYEAPELVACYTPEFLAAAAELAGDDPATFRPPTRGYAINIFPTSDEWHWPRPHIDHAIKDAGHKVFPRAFRIASMTYLSDVEPRGGGTVVWPGSCHKLEALARSDPERFELMWTLGQAIRTVELGDAIEVPARRGDILFYHYLCAHSGSQNVRRRPRFAMNMKW